jgi:hypothetical protein
MADTDKPAKIFTGPHRRLQKFSASCRIGDTAGVL